MAGWPVGPSVGRSVEQLDDDPLRLSGRASWRVPRNGVPGRYLHHDWSFFMLSANSAGIASASNMFHMSPSSSELIPMNIGSTSPDALFSSTAKVSCRCAVLEFCENSAGISNHCLTRFQRHWRFSVRCSNEGLTNCDCLTPMIGQFHLKSTLNLNLLSEAGMLRKSCLSNLFIINENAARILK